MVRVGGFAAWFGDDDEEGVERQMTKMGLIIIICLLSLRIFVMVCMM